MDEEEEMWFNEDDDFDDNEAVVPAATTDIPTKKFDPDLDGIGKIMDKKVEANGPKMNITPVKTSMLNNNASGGQPPSPTPAEFRSALFKRVSNIIYFVNLLFVLKIFFFLIVDKSF